MGVVIDSFSLTALGTAPINNGQRLAMQRPPSVLNMEVNHAKTMSFPGTIQPILTQRCTPCHVENNKGPRFSPERGTGNQRNFSLAYYELQNQVWYVSGRDKQHGADTMRSTPGQVGALASPLYHLLKSGSHKDLVTLSREEWQALTLWMDTNVPFLATYENQAAQFTGLQPDPTLE